MGFVFFVVDSYFFIIRSSNTLLLKVHMRILPGFVELVWFHVPFDIPSLSTRIVPLRFQAGGRRRRLNLGLVCIFCVLLVLSVFLS